MKDLTVYVGYDHREPDAYSACISSISAHSSEDVNIIKLDRMRLTKKQYWRHKSFPNEKASTDFAFTRFLVPYLNDFDGPAIFMDCDMIVSQDISKVLEFYDPSKAVSVVKHDYVPRLSEKMDGQKQVSYPRKNWSSFMLFNCGHSATKTILPNVVSNQSGAFLHRFEWCNDSEIGNLPLEWNWLEGEYDKPDEQPANIHYTNGGPWFEEVYKSRPIDYWLQYLEHAAIFTSKAKIADIIKHQLRLHENRNMHH